MRSLILAIVGVFLAGSANLALARSKDARIVELSVTSEGLQPSRVEVKKGERVKLAITRTLERTCFTKIVIAELGVERDLPLNERVVVEIKPKKAGQIDYVCGMGMKAGTLVVQ